MEFINYMRLRRAGSAESSNNASNFRRSTLGAWLSLSQPNPYICETCSKAFPSSQALGGHQNAHRKERSEARRRYIEECLVRMKQPLLSPIPLRVVPPNDGQNFGNWAVPMAKPAPVYCPLPVPQPGLDNGPRNVQGFVPAVHGYGAPGAGLVAGYGVQYGAPRGNHYYHRYLKPRRRNVIPPGKLNPYHRRDLTALANGGGWLEVVSCATPTDASDRAFGEDSDEVTSKRRLDLNLRL